MIKNGGVVERQLSGASVESIKQAISDNRFFELQGFYPPKDGVADYFSHSLTVTMDGRACPKRPWHDSGRNTAGVR